MPTNPPGGGTTTSFSNTPQAQTDIYSYSWLTEDWAGVYCFDVMSNDLGGNAKILWSVDNGTIDSGAPVPISSNGNYADTDLLVQDTARAEATSSDTSANGARIWITTDGKVGYDAGTLSASFKASLQALSVGETKTDTFAYAIRLGNGTLSWTTVTIVYQGANDGVQMAATASASVTEDVTISKSGTATFTDVDLHDTHTASFAADSHNTTHLGTFSLGTLTDGTSGSVGWTYNLDNAAAQYLGASDTVTETYIITVTDNHGASSQQAVTVTIHGTNDGPAAVLGGDLSGAVQEDSAIGMDGKLHDSGSFGFTDVDLSDTHSVSVTPDGSGYLGTLSASVSNDSTGDGAGQVDWSFAVDNSTVQYLADGQVVTQTYTVTVDDHNGGTVSQTVTVTITGTNDSPDIKVVGSDTASANLGETNAGLMASGTLTVLDPDTNDSVNVTVSSVSVGGTGGDGGIDHGALLGMLSLSGNSANAADGTQGSIGWNFNSGGQAFDYLPAGQTLVLTYTLTADDSHTGSDIQQVTITITGANDAAVIGDPAVHDVTEDVAVSGNLAATGTLAISDADTGEAHFSTSVTGDPANLGSLTLQADGSYSYSVANSAVQFLAGSNANGGTDSHVDTFTVTAADGTTKQVSFTIHGANDAAVIVDVGTPDFATIEAGGDNNGTAGDPNASGTLNVTDTDTGEGHFLAAAPASLNGTYGTFTFDETTGAWTYTLDNSRTATQALNQDDPATDTLTVHSADGTPHDIVVHITGANDLAVISEAAGADHILVEAGGIANGTAGDSTAGGTLSVSDVDDGESHFLAPPAASLSATYGTFTFDESTGTWTYTLDNDRGATQALNQGDPATDTLIVHSADGTAHDIVVHITGSNDAAVITEAAGGDHTLVEAGGIANGAAGDSTAGGTLSVSDVDDGENSFQTVASGDLHGIYGSFTFDEATGAWTYTLDNDRPATQALNEGAPASDTLTVRSADSTSHDIIVNITGANDAAVITEAAGGDHTLVEAGGIGNADTGDSTAGGTLTVSDVDAGQGSFVAAEASDLAGTYGTFTFDGTTGEWTYALDNSRTATQALIQDEHVTDTLTVHSDDGTAYTVTVNVTGTNDAPVVSAGGTLFYTENDAAAAIDPGLTLTDVDSGMLTGATVAITGGFAGGEDLLGFVAQNGITGSYNAATGVLTLSGSASVVDYEAALQSVTYANSSDDPSGATRTISFQVDDGATLDHASNVATASVSVTPVNDAPVATPVTLAAIAEDSGARIITQAELLAGVTDVDNTSAELTITALSLTSANGTLVDNGDHTWTYTPAADDDTSASFSYTVSDGDLTASSTASLDITPVNDAPVATITQASYSATEQTTLHLHGTGLSIGDVDAGSGSLTVTLAVTEGVITIFTGTTGAGVSNSGTSSVTITGTLAQINDLLDGNGGATVNYFDGSDSPATSATLTLTVHDNGNTGGGDLSSSDTATINITPVNDGPVATIEHTYGVIEQQNLTIHGTGLSVSDVDAGSGSLTVTLSVTEGVLNVAAGTSGALVSNSGTSAVTITGSQAQINDLLAGQDSATVVYNDNLDNPSSSVTLTLSVHDNGNTGGGDLSSSATTTITVAPVNDAPVVNNVSVSASAISFVATDPDNSTLTLTTPFDIAFGNPAVGNGGTTTLTPTAQVSVVSGTLQVTDGSLNASVVDLILGTNGAAGDTLTASGSTPTAIYGFDGNDKITGGTGADWLFGGNGADTINGSQEDVSIDGGSGTDKLNVGAAFTSVSDTQITNIEIVQMTAPGLLDLSAQTEGFIIGGTNGADTIIGSAGADTFVADNLGADNSVDSYSAGAGNDSISVGHSDDALIDGGTGVDTLIIGGATTGSTLFWASDSQIVNIENVTIQNGNITLDLSNQTEAFSITGSSIADSIKGGSSADSISAGGGNDTVFGAQNDILLDGGTDAGTGTRDELWIQANFASSTDAQIVNFETIRLVGAGTTLDLSNQTEGFTIIGSSSVSGDTIIGGAGADIINGEASNDTLTGSGGADQFRFDTVGGTDTVTDLAVATDRIGFRDGTGTGAVNFTTVGVGTGTGLLAADFQSRSQVTTINQNDDNKVIVINQAQTLSQIQNGISGNAGNHADNSYIVVFNSDTGKAEIWFDTNWNDTANRTQIATLSNITTLSGVTGLTASNFVVYDNTLGPAGASGSAISLGLSNASGLAANVALDISGLPSGWTLNHGVANADGTWTVDYADLADLSATAPAGVTEAALLTVSQTWTNADGSTGYAAIDDNLVAYASGTPIFAWSGDDTLSGSADADTFVFSQPIGADTVRGFDASHDIVNLIGYSGVGSFADVQAHTADDANGNAVISLGDGQSITLAGVSASSLTAGNFAFDDAPSITNSGTITVGNGAVMPLSGDIDNSGTISLGSTGSATVLQLIQNGITLTGGGNVVMSDSSANMITGTLPGVTLTNVDNVISGAGDLGGGSLTLVNGGTILANGVNALVIDTGSNVVTNTGTIEATGSGGLQIVGSIANDGLLLASGSSILIGGDVTGSGHVELSGSASVEFGGAANNGVALDSGATGLIVFDQSSGFSGTISGLDGDDRVDLRDLSFGVDSTLSYADDGSGGGVLTVTDGTNSVQLHLLGSYEATHFTLGSDGQGGLSLFG